MTYEKAPTVSEALGLTGLSPLDIPDDEFFPSLHIDRLKAEIAEWVLYSEAVAEVCDEDTFQKIEAEFELRKKAGRS